MNSIPAFFQKKEVKRIIIFALIIFVLFSVRSMMNLILLTFIFSYLMNRLVDFTVRRLRLNHKITVLILYTLIVGILTTGLVKYLPIITLEISQVIKQITNFSIQSYDNPLLVFLESILSS